GPSCASAAALPERPNEGGAPARRGAWLNFEVPAAAASERLGGLTSKLPRRGNGPGWASGARPPRPIPLHLVELGTAPRRETRHAASRIIPPHQGQNLRSMGLKLCPADAG